MKRFQYKWLLLFLVFSSSCKFNEFGENSIYYVLNGEPYMPAVRAFDVKYFFISGNSGTLNIPVQNDMITYYMEPFSGETTYRFNEGNNKIFFSRGQYYPDGETFVRILELDTIEHIISAVFEARIKDTVKHTSLTITKGRIYLKY